MGDVTKAEPAQAGYGLAYGLGAYGLWGLIPLYFKTVEDVAPLEVLAHRAMWSFVVLGLLLAAARRWGELRLALGSRAILMLALSTVLIGLNWLTFIYAVSTGQVLQSSLGYFILPLVSVLLGVVVLGERMRPWQWVSVGLAALGVLLLGVMVNTFPWIALVLALSFSVYGLLRKTMPVGGLAGLTVETMALTPLALAYLLFLWHTGTSTATRPGIWGLLPISGLVTTVPLLFFVAAARRLRLSTLGFLQYLTPTLQFLLAVVAFGEPFSQAQLLSFSCIWAAVILYSVDSFAAARRSALGLVEPD